MRDNPGRIAGALYLLLAVSVFRPIYVAGALIERDDPATTARNIVAHEALFRLGIASDLLTGLVCFVIAPAIYTGVRQSRSAFGNFDGHSGWHYAARDRLRECAQRCCNALPGAR